MTVSSGKNRFDETREIVHAHVSRTLQSYYDEMLCDPDSAKLAVELRKALYAYYSATMSVLDGKTVRSSEYGPHVFKLSPRGLLNLISVFHAHDAVLRYADNDLLCGEILFAICYIYQRPSESFGRAWLDRLQCDQDQLARSRREDVMATLGLTHPNPITFLFWCLQLGGAIAQVSRILYESPEWSMIIDEGVLPPLPPSM